MKPFVTPDSGQRTADTLKFTNHHLPITKSLHFKPSILVFFAASPQKFIDGKNNLPLSWDPYLIHLYIKLYSGVILWHFNDLLRH